MKITMFGLAGTGTSTCAKLLAKELEYEFKSSGNMLRAVAKDHNMTIEEFDALITRENDPKYDFELDDKVAKYGLENDDFVFESRLAWNFIPDSIKIKLECDLETAYNRVSQREGISYDKAKGVTDKRARDVKMRYSQIYPDLVFPPENSIFDLVIETDVLTPEEIVLTIKNFLKSRN